jgi:ABC-type dipeptide/oligopeptide/nickel transport system ATPase subunit
MFISWVDFSIKDYVKCFSLSLDANDFLFLAGETHLNKLFLALAGFLPEECNSRESIRINGQRDNIFCPVLLPKNAAKSFPPHRTIGAFALDLCNQSKKEIEASALRHGIENHILHSQPSKISVPDLQQISLWLCSLKTSSAIFVEEPSGGFSPECRPFDFLQGLLRNGNTGCIVYLASSKDVILQKAKVLQFCRSRIAVFCADRLVEEGEAAKVLANPVHPYTKEWLNVGSNRPLQNGTLWKYCHPNCKEQHNCPAKHSISFALWDCEPSGLHKVVCGKLL